MEKQSSALEANQLLKSDKIEDALNICLNVINEYPIYPTCYLLVIKSYILIKDYEKAKEYLDIAINFFPNLPIFKLLIDELNQFIDNYRNIQDLDFIEVEVNCQESNKLELSNNNIEKNYDEYKQLKNKNHYHLPIIILNGEEDESVDDKSTSLSESKPSNIYKMQKLFNVKKSGNINEGRYSQSLPIIPGLFFLPLKLSVRGQTKKNYISKLPPFPSLPTYIQDLFENTHTSNYDVNKAKDIYSLAQEIISYNYKENLQNEEIDKTDNLNDNIEITETIAYILFQQKAYKEALEAYRILKEKNPDKEEYFKLKINEIEDLLSGNNT